jgi:catechol 2,3-dioxygenase-like lactoylglutathione lyase family enzyme
MASFAGFRLAADTPEREQFRRRDGVLLARRPPTDGEPASRFSAAEDATVDAFHAALTAAGCRDGGAPGEQPVYHPGYYAAYVLDPDDNSVELVCHDR